MAIGDAAVRVLIVPASSMHPRQAIVVEVGILIVVAPTPDKLTDMLLTEVSAAEKDAFQPEPFLSPLTSIVLAP